MLALKTSLGGHALRSRFLFFNIDHDMTDSVYINFYSAEHIDPVSDPNFQCGAFLTMSIA